MSTHASSTFPTMANPPFHSCCKQELVSKPRRFLKCPLSMRVCMLLWQPRGHNPEKNYGLPVCSCLWMWATGREGQMVSHSHKDSQLWEWERGGTSDESHGVPVKHTNSSPFQAIFPTMLSLSKSTNISFVQEWPPNSPGWVPWLQGVWEYLGQSDCLQSVLVPRGAELLEEGKAMHLQERLAWPCGTTRHRRLDRGTAGGRSIQSETLGGFSSLNYRWSVWPCSIF